MGTLNSNDKEFGQKLALTHTEKRLADVLAYVLTDAVTDIEVASRDLHTSDASFARLHRALDRLTCAQTLLESMAAGSARANDEESALQVKMRGAVGLLAREWPEEYPAGAVEWPVAVPGVRPALIALDQFDHVK